MSTVTGGDGGLSAAAAAAAAATTSAGVSASHCSTCHSSTAATPKVVYFDNTKAGLQAVDKVKTEARIAELSKNSSFYANEERKARRRQQQIEKLLVKTRHYEASVRSRPDVLRQLQRDVADLEAGVEAHRSFRSVYVHVDMDMFYAAVEMKKNPQYTDVPLGIGGMSMLSTTNYHARLYGVRSGMPGFIGVQLCPALVIVPTDFDAYRAESATFKAVVREYDPEAHGLGLDEILLCLDSHLAQHHPDATSHAERFDAAERVVQECRQRIAAATGLTASAGIAPTPTLAKMASNHKKPDGQSTMRLFSREAVLEYLAGVPVRHVPGIGKSQETILAGLGIHTLGEVYEQRHRLYHILTRKTYLFLLSSALGVGGMYDSLEATAAATAAAASGDTSTGNAVAAVNGESVEEDTGRKSVGHERTFAQLRDRAELVAVAYDNLHRSHETLVAECLLASQVVLKLKYRSFHVKQFTKSLPVYTDVHAVLQRALDELLLPVGHNFTEFRLLGVRLERLRQRPPVGGDGGVTTLTTHSHTEADTTQPTLHHFFTRQQRSAVEAAATQREGDTTQLYKRHRETLESCDDDDDNGSEADLVCDDEDNAVLVVSSESQLTDPVETEPRRPSIAPHRQGGSHHHHHLVAADDGSSSDSSDGDVIVIVD
ncbi:DNA polymerase kappa [Novymonas esmeraldas]|uniref:DNA polymerase kappa n=1 Tax=Novymonas esmeraldas TaxID=1808958 RepID=A0AAW0EPX5_9TRYP